MEECIQFKRCEIGVCPGKGGKDQQEMKSDM